MDNLFPYIVGVIIIVSTISELIKGFKKKFKPNSEESDNAPSDLTPDEQAARQRIKELMLKAQEEYAKSQQADTNPQNTPSVPTQVLPSSQNQPASLMPARPQQTTPKQITPVEPLPEHVKQAPTPPKAAQPAPTSSPKPSAVMSHPPVPQPKVVHHAHAYKVKSAPQKGMKHSLTSVHGINAKMMARVVVLKEILDPPVSLRERRF